MKVPSLKRHLFLASFLLSHVSPLFMTSSWGMIAEEEKISIPKQQVRPNLSTTLEAFETGQDEQARQMLIQLRQAGATIPTPYLEYMKVDCPLTFESIPPKEHELAQDFFKASLCRRNYLTAKEDTEKKKHILALGDMITKDKNIHAVSVLKNIYKKDISILNYFSDECALKKLKSLNDFYKILDPAFSSFLDPDFLLYEKEGSNIFAKKELAYFSKHYREGKYSLLQIIKKLMIDTLKTEKPFWAHLAVENGINEGCVVLADFYDQNPNMTASFLYYTSCINVKTKFEFERQINVFFHASNILAEKNGRSNIKTRLYLKRAANLGESTGQSPSFGCFGTSGEQVDKEKNLESLKLSAETGNAEHSYVLGDMYFFEGGGQQRLENALKYYKLSANQGHGAASFILGDMYFHGHEVQQDFKEALKYYVLSANNTGNLGASESIEAQYKVAHMLYTSVKGPQNFLEAFKYYNHEVQQDFKKALMYYLISTNNTGNLGASESIEAQYKVAHMLNTGVKGPQNFLEAFKYYKMAAEKGHKGAIIMLDRLKNEIRVLCS